MGCLLVGVESIDMWKAKSQSHSKVLMFAVSLFLAGCAVHASAPGNILSMTPEKCDDAGESVERLAAEFRELRATPGHFAGGEWNDDLDEWMGRKHQVMIELRSVLGSGGYSEAEVIEHLGLPDEMVRRGDELFTLVSSLPEFEEPATGSCELFIYHWRGAHDFLYFISSDETIVGSGWWYAGE